MTLPVRSETRETHNLIKGTQDSLRRSKDLLKTLKSSFTVTDKVDLRRALKRTVKQVKKAIAEADTLAKQWMDRVERVTDD